MTTIDPIYDAIADYEEYASAIIGKNHEPIATYVKEDGRQYIDLNYGGANVVRIRIDGYNMMFIMKSLYNNPVTNSLLE